MNSLILRVLVLIIILNVQNIFINENYLQKISW